MSSASSGLTSASEAVVSFLPVIIKANFLLLFDKYRTIYIEKSKTIDLGKPKTFILSSITKGMERQFHKFLYSTDDLDSALEFCGWFWRGLSLKRPPKDIMQYVAKQYERKMERERRLEEDYE